VQRLLDELKSQNPEEAMTYFEATVRCSLEYPSFFTVILLNVSNLFVITRDLDTEFGAKQKLILENEIEIKDKSSLVQRCTHSPSPPATTHSLTLCVINSRLQIMSGKIKKLTAELKVKDNFIDRIKEDLSSSYLPPFPCVIAIAYSFRTVMQP
jgi:hypothetical protein